MDKTVYVVTESAGPKVAGRRANRGDELLLTEFEARAELIAGSLRPKESEPVAEGAEEEAGAATETGAEEPAAEAEGDAPTSPRRRR